MVFHFFGQFVHLGMKTFHRAGKDPIDRWRQFLEAELVPTDLYLTKLGNKILHVVNILLPHQQAQIQEAEWLIAILLEQNSLRFIVHLDYFRQEGVFWFFFPGWRNLNDTRQMELVLFHLSLYDYSELRIVIRVIYDVYSHIPNKWVFSFFSKASSFLIVWAVAWVKLGGECWNWSLKML